MKNRDRNIFRKYFLQFKSWFSGLWYRVVKTTSHWKWRQQGSPKLWYPTTSLYGIITQKAMIWIFIAMQSSSRHFYSSAKQKCYNRSTFLTLKIKTYTERTIIFRLFCMILKRDAMLLRMNINYNCLKSPGKYLDLRAWKLQCD